MRTSPARAAAPDRRGQTATPTSPCANRDGGAGGEAGCSKGLWAALDAAGAELAAVHGADPTAWRADATKERIHFAPGILTTTMRWSNRPTYQQILSFDGHR